MKPFATAQVNGLRKIFEKYGLPNNARVLDLQSGIGRISVYLAKLGYDVVGVDISPLYLGLAEKWVSKERLTSKVKFYRADARKTAKLLNTKGEKFDAVVSIGTSIGYYGEEDDARTFRSLRSITNPGSILVVETVNRDYLVKHFQEHSIEVQNGIEKHESRKLNLETSFMENTWKFYRRIRKSLRLVLSIPVSHRVYSLHELNKLLEWSGWKPSESYGSLRELTPVSTDSFHMTVVGRK